MYTFNRPTLKARHTCTHNPSCWTALQQNSGSEIVYCMTTTLSIIHLPPFKHIHARAHAHTHTHTHTHPYTFLASNTTLEAEIWVLHPFSTGSSLTSWLTSQVMVFADHHHQSPQNARTLILINSGPWKAAKTLSLSVCCYTHPPSTSLTPPFS